MARATDRYWPDYKGYKPNKRNPNQQLLSRYLKEQGLLEGNCTLCKKHGKLVLDHDHETGEFRARLCSSCNVGLGMFNDNAELLRSAADYITYHKVKK